MRDAYNKRRRPGTFVLSSPLSPNVTGIAINVTTTNLATRGIAASLKQSAIAIKIGVWNKYALKLFSAIQRENPLC